MKTNFCFFLILVTVCLSCSKNDEQDFLFGEFQGTIKTAYHYSSSNDEYMKFYSNPEWNSAPATIQITDEGNQSLRIRCVSNIATFEETYNYETTSSGIRCTTGSGLSITISKKGKLEYSLFISWLSGGGYAGGGIQGKNIIAFKK